MGLVFCYFLHFILTLQWIPFLLCPPIPVCQLSFSQFNISVALSTRTVTTTKWRQFENVHKTQFIYISMYVSNVLREWDKTEKERMGKKKRYTETPWISNKMYNWIEIVSETVAISLEYTKLFMPFVTKPEIISKPLEEFIQYWNL